YDAFENPKIIWGELSDDQKFSFDESGSFANNTIFFMIGNDLKYILAVLNSKIAKWYFLQISTTSGMGTNRWLKYKIEQLPIKIPTPAQQSEIEALVEKIIEGKKNGEDTSAWEAEIDALVYALYGLSEEEIAVIDPTYEVSKTL
ncbi:MAG: hypothetical protein MUE30_11540, partial [Spirosomaceae bacterium]|nr:hypothetical protein [Spirosomataceae bacterium]